ncbi:MAG: hypothetical protein WBI18_01405 [Candidatus Saccharicenans sp.]
MKKRRITPPHQPYGRVRFLEAPWKQSSRLPLREGPERPAIRPWKGFSLMS